ncbi:MAG TPA: metallophosphoesterase [Fibrobacteria bacterium]|nr:metallophosphoesterase [Fibrobacteria bacterium]HOX51006.1 metallophosphoesterase [Fibrobacteria bacterium]
MIVALRMAMVGCFAWLMLFNRICMVDQDDRRKIRRGGWLLLAFVGVPVLAALLWPEVLDGPSWLLFLWLIGWECNRLARQAIGFSSARSQAVGVAGVSAGIVCTDSLQVRSYQFAGAGEHMDGLTVAFLSDFHCSGYPSCDWYDQVWRMISGIGPDLVLLGGDYLDAVEDVPLMERAFHGAARLSPLLGIHAILGNHDEVASSDVRRVLRRSGVSLLEDRWVALQRGPGRIITLHGTSSPFAGSHDPLSGAPPGGADLCLTHTPDNAPSLARRGTRFILAGHTHGGQIGFPLLGALLTPSRFSRKWSYGTFRVGESHLVVTSGLGCEGIPLRVLVRPEIVVLRFHA